VNETLAALGLEKHSDKTFIGRVAKGFDFLGYRLSPKGLAVAKQTWDRFVERAVRLQERERTGRAPRLGRTSAAGSSGRKRASQACVCGSVTVRFWRLRQSLHAACGWRRGRRPAFSRVELATAFGRSGIGALRCWRRGWDSNPRTPCEVT
jgi:hypothetical protein